MAAVLQSWWFPLYQLLVGIYQSMEQGEFETSQYLQNEIHSNHSHQSCAPRQCSRQELDFHSHLSPSHFVNSKYSQVLGQQRLQQQISQLLSWSLVLRQLVFLVDFLRTIIKDSSERIRNMECMTYQQWRMSSQAL